jgi:hypothetical protein
MGEEKYKKYLFCGFPCRESIRRSLRKFRKNKTKGNKENRDQEEEEDNTSRKASYQISICYSKEDLHNIETQSISGHSIRKL